MGNIFSSKTKFVKLELEISKQGLKINGVLYPINIEFDNNEIIVCDPLKSDYWIKEFLDDPMNFKKYIVNYQEKKYEVLAETLLTIIIYKLKKEIKGIINEFELIVENDKD